MNVSLSKFCKDRNLSKTSVYRRCQELNLDVSNGLDVGAVALLEHEFDCQPSAPIRPEVMPQDFIQSGQLVPFESRDIQLPEGSDPSAMVKFFDGVTGQVTDTRSLVAIADLALNAVESALDEKISQQRQQLTQAEKDGDLS